MNESTLRQQLQNAVLTQPTGRYQITSLSIRPGASGSATTAVDLTAAPVDCDGATITFSLEVPVAQASSQAELLATVGGALNDVLVGATRH